MRLQFGGEVPPAFREAPAEQAFFGAIQQQWLRLESDKRVRSRHWWSIGGAAFAK